MADSFDKQERSIPQQESFFHTYSEPLLYFCTVLGIVCAVFSATGAVFLLITYGNIPEFNTPGMHLGLLVRAAGFTGIALVGLWGLRRFRKGAVSAKPKEDHQPPSFAARDYRLLLPALIVSALLLFPYLNAYPWTAPDEVHHMNVARNLAFHGVYASGNPESGFVHFDPYDSVGAPVIMPVALSFKFFGVSPFAARIIIALYFLLLQAALFTLLLPAFGRYRALTAAILLPMAFSSIYLGRTLYGEVPALAWFVWGVCCWQQAFTGRRQKLLALCAGLCFGLSILSKTIMILTAFPFAGVLVADWLSSKRIRLRHLFFPALGVGLVFMAWWLYMGIKQGDSAENAQTTVGMYHHYLLFGLEPFWKNFNNAVLAWPWAHIVIGIGLITLLPAICLRNQRPALLVLFLVAGFYFYWWLFFTPGQLPRYLWISYAIGAIAAAHLLAGTMRLFRQSDAVLKKGLVVLALVLIAGPYVRWTAQQAHEVYTNREMTSVLHVCSLINDLPAETRIGTTHPPLQGIVELFGNRQIKKLAEAPADKYDIVVTLKESAFADFTLLKTFGPYHIWTKPQDRTP